MNAFGGEPSMIADSMNITQSIALENMNEMSECGKHYIQNPPVNNGNLTSFNKFDPGHQKINFYQTQEMKELQEFELLEQKLKNDNDENGGRSRDNHLKIDLGKMDLSNPVMQQFGTTRAE